MTGTFRRDVHASAADGKIQKSELLELVKDKAWLVKVTNAVNQHWHKQNAAKKNSPANGSQNARDSLADQSSATGG